MLCMNGRRLNVGVHTLTIGNLDAILLADLLIL